ncbi:MAG: hypothetical protein H6693_09890 [Candidatus Latescibacteria bacterium]|nr:hypothetical protein [Candidatus Latescibacterota bacterium]
MNRLGRVVETDLGELLGIARRRWSWLLATGLVAGVVALGVSFAIPPRYHSVASVLPATGVLRDRALLLGTGGLGGAAQVRPNTSSNGQNLVVASSLKVREEIVDQLELVRFFGREEQARKDPALARELAMVDLRLATHFELSIYRDVLFIHVITRDPDMSATIANLYIELIQRENLSRYHARAKSMERYLSRQLSTLRAEIASVSDSLAALYRADGLVDIDGERDDLFSLLTTLRLQRSALALSLSRESLDRSADDPALARLRDQIKIYDAFLDSYRPGGSAEGARDLRALLDQGRVLQLRDVEARLKSLQAQEADLRTELEVSVMEGARDEALLPVMDRAFPASEPYWPRRWLITVSAMLLATGVLYLGLVYHGALVASSAPRGR